MLGVGFPRLAVDLGAQLLRGFPIGGVISLVVSVGVIVFRVQVILKGMGGLFRASVRVLGLRGDLHLLGGYIPAHHPHGNVIAQLHGRQNAVAASTLHFGKAVPRNGPGHDLRVKILGGACPDPGVLFQVGQAFPGVQTILHLGDMGGQFQKILPCGGAAAAQVGVVHGVLGPEPVRVPHFLGVEPHPLDPVGGKLFYRLGVGGNALVPYRADFVQAVVFRPGGGTLGTEHIPVLAYLQPLKGAFFPGFGGLGRAVPFQVGLDPVCDLHRLLSVGYGICGVRFGASRGFGFRGRAVLFF